MFCKNCGKELGEEIMFCPDCGTKRTEIPGGNTGAQKEASGPDENSMTAETESIKAEGIKTESIKAENINAEKKEPGRNIFSKIWNSELFTKTAVKFGNVLEILEGIIFLILCRMLFKEGGFWGVVFGIVFALGGAGGCFSGITSLLSRRKKNGEGGIPEETDDKSLNKKKRNLCIGVVVIVIALAVFKNTGGGTYYIVQSISFDDMGSETVGELVDENIKGAEWSQKKLDKNSRLVYVEGYCPSYGGTVRIEFYCEKLKDGSHEVSLNGISLPDSNEELSKFEAAIVWASFYQ